MKRLDFNELIVVAIIVFIVSILFSKFVTEVTAMEQLFHGFTSVGLLIIWSTYTRKYVKSKYPIHMLTKCDTLVEDTMYEYYMKVALNIDEMVKLNSQFIDKDVEITAGLTGDDTRIYSYVGSFVKFRCKISEVNEVADIIISTYEEMKNAELLNTKANNKLLKKHKVILEESK